MPYISAPYRIQSQVNNVRASILQVPIADTADRHIDLAPWPESIDENRIVKFLDNGLPETERMRCKVCKPGVLIFASGYRQEFPFSDDSYINPGEANIRNIWECGDETVGFIGFVRPSFGVSASFKGKSGFGNTRLTICPRCHSAPS
jgi:dimethylaniline monooxygenase (N-oxide forming)